jgi:hypothetical protein
VTDARGNVYTPIRLELTIDEIAELKRRAAAPGARYSGDQIQAMFKALEAEWDRTGGFDQEHARKFIRRLDTGEAPDAVHGRLDGGSQGSARRPLGGRFVPHPQDHHPVIGNG